MFLVDFSPVLVSVLYAISDKRTKQFDPIEYRNAILRTLLSINTKYRKNYGSMILAVDDPTKQYWRKEIFPNYKGNRIKDDKVDWQLVYEVLDGIKQGIIKAFPWRVIEVKRAEADDIIATLTNFTIEPTMIISPDGDFKQLQTRKNVSQFDSGRVKNVKTDAPEWFLKEKIIRGDRKDGIANINTDKDHLTNVIKLKAEGLPVTKQKTIPSKEIPTWVKSRPEFFCSNDQLQRYKLNEQLLDFNHIPVDIHDAILDIYINDKQEKTMSLMDYFVEIKESMFIPRINDFK